MANYYNYNQGLGHVGSFQTSGKPFVTGSLTAPATGSTPLRIEFPQVTRWFTIANTSNQHIRFGFSEEGVNGTNHFITHEENHPTQNGPYEMKITDLYILSDAGEVGGIYVMAGLTSIDRTAIIDNWSGSSGV